MSDDDDLFAQVRAMLEASSFDGSLAPLSRPDSRTYPQIFGGTPAAAPAKAASQVKQEAFPKQGGHIRQEPFQHPGLEPNSA